MSPLLNIPHKMYRESEDHCKWIKKRRVSETCKAHKLRLKNKPSIKKIFTQNTMYLNALNDV